MSDGKTTVIDIKSLGPELDHSCSILSKRGLVYLQVMCPGLDGAFRAVYITCLSWAVLYHGMCHGSGVCWVSSGKPEQDNTQYGPYVYPAKCSASHVLTQFILDVSYALCLAHSSSTSVGILLYTGNILWPRNLHLVYRLQQEASRADRGSRWAQSRNYALEPFLSIVLA